MDLASESDLVLLPIGFKKPYSPFDFISNKTTIKEASSEVRQFIQNIIDSTKRLNEKGIDEPILADFKVNLINEKRIKNADIIAGINNKLDTGIDITVVNSKQIVRTSDSPDALKVILTRDKNAASGTFLHEELSKELFHEINNVVDANTLLASGKPEFFFNERVYYRIYAERDHVSYNVNNVEQLARTGLSLYAPHLFWFANLPPKSCAAIIINFVRNEKFRQMNAIIRMAILFGSTFCEWLFQKVKVNWDDHPQPPAYYWKIKALAEKGWKKDNRFVAIKKTATSTYKLPGDSKQYPLGDFIEDQEFASSALSQVSKSVFDGARNYKVISREIDVLTYGKAISNKSLEIESEIMKIEAERSET